MRALSCILEDLSFFKSSTLPAPLQGLDSASFWSVHQISEITLTF
jgi:hypothetical protein